MRCCHVGSLCKVMIRFAVTTDGTDAVFDDGRSNVVERLDFSCNSKGTRFNAYSAGSKKSCRPVGGWQKRTITNEDRSGERFEGDRA